MIMIWIWFDREKNWWLWLHYDWLQMIRHIYPEKSLGFGLGLSIQRSSWKFRKKTSLEIQNNFFWFLGMVLSINFPNKKKTLKFLKYLLKNKKKYTLFQTSFLKIANWFANYPNIWEAFFTVEQF